MFSKVAEIGVQRGNVSECILKINQPKELHLIDCWEHQDSSIYINDPGNLSQYQQDR